MGKSYYKPGDNKVICDTCGRAVKASSVKKTWDGFYVCVEHWEPRHPQDFVRSVKDDQTVKISRPNTEPTFVAEAESLLLPPNPLGV